MASVQMSDSITIHNSKPPIILPKFSKYEYLWLSDMNAGQFASNQAQYDTITTANNSTYIDWSKSYFAIPYTIVTTTTGAGDSVYRLAVATKSSFIDFINSAQVKLNDVNIVNTNPNANALTNIRLLLEMDASKQEQIGDLLDFAANDMRVDPLGQASVDTGTINTAIPAVDSPSTGLPIYNKGLTRRASALANSPSLGRGANVANGTRNQVFFTGGAAAGAINQYVYYGVAVIRAADIHDCFRQFDFPAKNCRWIVYLNLNTNSAGQCLPLMLTAGSITGNAISINQQSLSIGNNNSGVAVQQISLNGPALLGPVFGGSVSGTISGGTTLTTAGAVPYFVASMIGAVVSGPGIVDNVVNGIRIPTTITGVTSTSVATLSFGQVNIGPNTFVLSSVNQPIVTNVPTANPFGNQSRWYYPKITLHPEIESKMLAGGSLQRVVPYYDWNFFKYTNPAGNSNINTQIFQGLPNVTKIIVFQIVSGSALLSNSIEPCGTSPNLDLSNIYVQINGQNYYSNSIDQGYTYEQYTQNMLPEFAGGISQNSLTSGLLSYSAWQSRGQFYIFDVSRNPMISSPDVPVAFQLSCTTNSLVSSDIWVFALSESAVEIEMNSSGASMVRSLDTATAAKFVEDIY